MVTYYSALSSSAVRECDLVLYARCVRLRGSDGHTIVTSEKNIGKVVLRKQRLFVNNGTEVISNPLTNRNRRRKISSTLIYITFKVGKIITLTPFSATLLGTEETRFRNRILELLIVAHQLIFLLE